MPESLCWWGCRPKAWNYIKKENLAYYKTPPLVASERVIWFSDKETETEREKERSKEYGYRQKQNYNILHQCNQAEKTILLMLRIIFKDTFLVYPADAVLRWWIFWIVSDSASSFFTAMWSSCSWIFWNFQKKFSKKAAWWSLGLLMLQRVVFRTELNNYDGASLWK